MNEQYTGLGSLVVIRPNSSKLQTFSSEFELMQFELNKAASEDILGRLEQLAPDFAKRSDLTQRLVKFAERIVAECVAAQLSSGPVVPLVDNLARSVSSMNAHYAAMVSKIDRDAISAIMKISNIS